MATIRKRTGRHGDETYTVMVRRAGFPTLTETFPTKKLAEQWATKQEAAILEGKVSKDAQGRKRTIADAVDKFRKEVLPLKKNGSMYGFTLDWWVEKHGQQKLGEVTRGWLSSARGELLTGTFSRATPGSKRSVHKCTCDRVDAMHRAGCPAGEASTFQRTPATCNRYMAALSAVFSQVCGDWEWLQPTANPFVGFSKLPEGRNKGRAYADEARARLLQETAKDPQLHTLVLVALGTAARAGELLALTWSHVELGETEGRLMFTDTKNGEARIAWLYGDALAAMKAQRMRVANERTWLIDSVRLLNKPVFPGQWSHKAQKYGRYDYLPRLHKALTAAGLDMKRPFHALRHTAATMLARRGANGHQLKAFGGWKSNAVDTYIHLAAQDTKELARRLAGPSNETPKA